MGPDPGGDLQLLIDAAEEGGKIAMSYYQNDVETHEKPDDQGPVTKADLDVNAMLLGMLGTARPTYGWLSEESDDDPARLAQDRVFIIDPIDGTRAFIAGQPGFSIVVAIAEEGEVTHAAVHLPARGETFAAARGRGTTKNGQPVGVTDPADITAATVLTAKVQMQPDRWGTKGPPPMERHFRSSLAWRLCLVAEGRFDSMLTFRRTYEWDIAAGALIASEAGAKVTDGDGAAFRFNSPEAMQNGIIAACPDLHREIMGYRPD